MTMFPIPPVSPLAVDFIAMFSRLESAMKQCKKYRTVKRGYVEADWQKLSDELSKLYDDISEDEGARELIHFPPKHQIVIKDELEWEAQPPKCQNMQAVIRALKNLRNNLFHGHKGYDESCRDWRLYVSAIYLMNKILEQATEISEFYYF